MCLQFVFLLITRVTMWLRLSRRKEAWKTAEILILRQQLAVLQRRQPRRPHLTWADRALLATLLGVIPKARRHGLRLLVTRTRSCAGTATSSAAAGPSDPSAARPAGQPPAGTSGPWSSGWPARTPNGGTAGSTANWPAWESTSRRRPYGRSSRPAASTPPATTDRADLAAVPALPSRGDPGLRLLHSRPARRHPSLRPDRDRAHDTAHPHPQIGRAHA